MKKMTKMERVKACLAGQPVDRPPFIAWGPHLNLEDRNTNDFTKAVIAYEDQHDFDILKVMQNGLYFAEDFGHVAAPPENSDDAGFKKTVIPAINSVQTMANLTTRPITQGALAREMENIRILSEYYKDRVPVLATVFGPYRTFCHMSGYYGMEDRNVSLFGGNMIDFIKLHESEFFHTMEVLTQQCIMNMRGFLQQGAAGFFFCTGGTYPMDPFTDDEYEKYIYPFDKQVLDAVMPDTIFMMHHICGDNVQHLEKMLTLPGHAVNWEDDSPMNPSIAQMRRLTDKVLMGGVDRHHDFYGADREKVKQTIRAKVLQSMKEAGDTRFISAVGCESPREITHRFVVWHEVMDEIAQENIG